MKIDILTLFPKMFREPFDESIIRRAQSKGLVEIKIHNLRDWAKDKRQTVDDRPFGGGTGMILMCQPVFDAVNELSQKAKSQKPKVVLLTPQGKTFNQKIARRLAKTENLIFVCGHYEGVDERIRKYLIDEEISIGDYVLTGGELPAMIVTDTIIRLIPGVLKKSAATQNESFSYYDNTYYHSKNRQKEKNKDINQLKRKLLEFPQYTRPVNFKGWKVPKILLSGNHKEIEKWRKKEALARTKTNRPDLLR